MDRVFDRELVKVELVLEHGEILRGRVGEINPHGRGFIHNAIGDPFERKVLVFKFSIAVQAGSDHPLMLGERAEDRAHLADAWARIQFVQTF
jgi:hypothetical protein